MEINDQLVSDQDAEYQVRQSRGVTLNALRQDIGLRNLLIQILDEGWTTEAERRDIAFLKSL